MLTPRNIDESDPFPRVRVGNVRSGVDSGTVTITPAQVYGNEKGRDFRINFKAKGPMYDSAIRITIPPVTHPESMVPDGPDSGDR